MFTMYSSEWDVTKYLGVFAFSLLICSYIYSWIKSWNYPPGPIGLPIVGYYPFLGRKPHVTLRDLGKKHGDVFSYYTGPQLIICVNDYHLIKEILSHPFTLSRPPHSFDLVPGKGGFGGMNGEEWLEQRRFVIHSMRNLGLGKGLWETMIQQHASELVDELKKYGEKPVFFEDILAFSKVSNSLALLCGKNLDPEKDKNEIDTLRKFGRQLMENFSAVSIFVNLPWLTKIVEFVNPPSFKEMMKILRNLESIFIKEVNNRLKSKETDERDDFIGCYIKEIEKRKLDDKKHAFTEENLLGNLMIMFSAGQDSTVASLTWMIVLMAYYQDVQKKVWAEIDEAVGRDGIAYYDDRPKFPYCQATILEMFRWTSISAIFPPRHVLETFTFHGYTIPKGSQVICNNWAMSHDPRYFNDPMEFKPERFLDNDGNPILKVEGYGPFSFGKRNCPGDGIALMTVYLYFVIIMQKFNILPPEGESVDLTSDTYGGILPKLQKLRFLER